MSRWRRPPNQGVGQLVPTDVAARMTTQGWTQPTVAATPPGPNLSAQDSLLAQTAADAEAFFKNYSGRSLAQPDAPNYLGRPPHLDMPAGAQPYFTPGTIATPAANGTDTTVLQFQVPIGWDGVIQRIANFYTGPGFTIGSGDFVWRIERNGQPIRGFDSIPCSFGTFGNGGVTPYEISTSPILIFEGELISWVVNHAVTSVLPIGGTSIFAFCGGYFYSRG
jgi:hypothetical protein